MAGPGQLWTRARGALVLPARAHIRTIGPVAVVVFAGLVVSLLLLLIYAGLIGPTAFAQVAELATAPESATTTLLWLTVPVIVGALVALVIWAGVVTQVASGAIVRRRVSTIGTVGRSVLRFPLATLVGVVALLAVALAIVLTPVIVAVGILGLIASLFVRTPRWPRPAVFVVMAIPLAAAFWMLARVCLALPSVWLTKSGLRGSFADGAERARGREAQVAAAVVISAAITLGASAGLSALVALTGLGSAADFVAQVVALALVGPLVLVALTVQYHRGGPAPELPPAAALPAVSRRSRIAVATVIALLVPVSIVGSSAPAQAAGTTPVSIAMWSSPDSPIPADSTTTIFIGVRDTASETTQPTGSLQVFINSVEQAGPFTLPGGAVAVTLDRTFAAGTYLVEAYYSGDDTYQAGYQSLTIVAEPPVVDPVATHTSFTITPASPSAAGVRLTAQVLVTADGGAAPVGSVKILLDGSGDPLGEEPLTAAQAGRVDVGFDLPPGTHRVVAYFEGATGFLPSSIDETHRVLTAPSTLSLTTATPTVVGQPLTLVATVNSVAVATGTVSFEARSTAAPDVAIPLGTQSLVAGVATFAPGALPLGSYTISANYAGDGAVTGSTSPSVPHTVGKAAVTVGVTSTTPAAAFGDDVRLVIAVGAAAPGAGIPTGSIVVKRDGATVGSGSLTAGSLAIVVPAGAAGDRVFVAEYAGSADFIAGSGSLSYTVGKVATITVLGGLDPRSHVYGDSQVFDGRVSTAADESTPSGTVEILVGGVAVASGTLDAHGEFEITTDEIPVQLVSTFDVSARYLGDDDHAPSEVAPGGTISLELSKKALTPVLMVGSVDPIGVGSTVTLTATVPRPGVGPTGLVTFSTPDGAIGSAAIEDGVASIQYTITGPSTRVMATWTGDGNFTSNPIQDLVITASRSVVTVELTADAPLTYGTLVNLVADVSIAGGAVPTDRVQFETTVTVIRANVPVIDGKATLQVCVGDDAVCPDDVPVIGVESTDLTARYPLSATNLQGVSSPLPYVVLRAATAVEATVTPTVLQPGHAVFLTAKVTGPNPTMIPRGTVSFWGKEPSTTGETLSFIGSDTLDSAGEASIESVVGDGATDLRWPAESVVATYSPGSAPYAGSRDTVTITLTRIGVQVGVTISPTPAANAVVTATANLTHDPGVSAPFTGRIVFTSDTGETCTAFLPDNDCTFRWPTAGSHTVTAAYSGDVIYAEKTSSAHPVELGKGSRALNAVAPTTALVGETVTVQWNAPDVTAGGTVTVSSDGDWCTVPVTDGQCTGQFGTGAAGRDALVIVQYSGDANWNQTQEELTVRVSNCAILDVRSSSESLGTVTVNTPPNCGASGYLIGTPVQVTATPRGSNEFAHWLGYTADGLVPVSTTTTTTFTLTAQSESWVRVGVFRVPCYPVSGSITGSGEIFVYPASNCTTPGGAAGWLRGTEVKVSPLPRLSPQYGEVDDFYRFGQSAVGVTSTDSSGVPWLAFTVNGPVSVPLVFGPQCHVVTVALAPASAGDSSTVSPQPNCVSPTTSGYTRGTVVTIEAKAGNPDHAITGWSVNGVTDAALTRANPTTFTVAAGNPTVTANFTQCYTLDLVIDGAQDAFYRDIGKVVRDAPPNCIDGSARYTTGTVVTLTPEVLVDTASFAGWDAEKLNLTPTPQGGTGIVKQGIREITMTQSLKVVAGFYLAAVCSRLTVTGEAGLVSKVNITAFGGTGCGNGYYYDLQKVAAIRSGGVASDQWQQKSRTELTVTVPATIPSDVYLTVTGDTRHCFGVGGDPQGPSTNVGAKSYGPVTGKASCFVGGPIRVSVQACQTIETVPQIIVTGSNSVQSGWTPPSIIYVPGEDGAIGAYSMEGFRWVDGIPVSVQNDGSIMTAGMTPGACADSERSYVPGTELALVPLTPGGAYTFVGWQQGDELDLSTPLITTTTATERVLRIEPVYSVGCYSLSLGAGITVEPNAPYCPGTSPEQNSFVAGMAVPVRAQFRLDGRAVEKFTSGVVTKQVYEEEGTLDLIAYAYMDGDKSVNAFYPTDVQRVGSGVTQGLKIVAGVLAVAAPIIIGMAFPPVGITLGILGAAAGIASLAGNDKAAAVFDLINPAKILTCAARWGFGNSGNPTGGNNIGSILSTANRVRKVLMGTDVTKVNITNLGGLTGSASFVLGLYSAGIQNVSFDTMTSADLADTATMTGCLNDQWRAAGSNL